MLEDLLKSLYALKINVKLSLFLDLIWLKKKTHTKMLLSKSSSKYNNHYFKTHGIIYIQLKRAALIK